MRKILFTLLPFLLSALFRGCQSALISCDFLEVVASEDISEKCMKQLHIVCNNDSVSWKMYDASSRFLFPGMSYSNALDYGNFPECLSIEHKENGERILGKYCGMGLMIPNLLVTDEGTRALRKLGIDINSTHFDYKKQIISLERWNQIDYELRDSLIPGFDGLVISKLAVCVPDACTARETALFYLYGYLEAVPLVIFTDFPCETKETNTTLEGGDIAVVTLLVVVLLIMIVSTAYDYVCSLYDRKPYHPLLIAFSIVFNGKKLLETSKNKTEQIQIFNGMRFISMAWVVAFHGAVPFQLKMAFLENVPAIVEWESNWTVRYIRSGLLAVDTFFYISGFLLAFTYLKRNTGKGFITQLIRVPEMYLHRYLRLTPAAGMMFLIFITLFRFTGTGPAWGLIVNMYMDSCKKYWWQFFLYVQNYTNPDDLCVIPSWYLSADMQMFFFAPIVIIPTAMMIKKYYMPTFLSLGALTVFWIIFPMIKRYCIDYEEGNIYTSHARFNNFLIGIMFGAYMRFNKDKPFIFTPLQNFCLWILTLLVSLTIVIYWHDVFVNYELLKYTIFMGLYRPIYCICLCFMVYSCYHGHGGFIEWFLSRQFFQILAKMCYSMYVMHTMVLSYFSAHTRNSTYFSNYMLFYRWCGHFVVTMVLALIWVLAFEFPMMTVDKYLLGDGLFGRVYKFIEPNNKPSEQKNGKQGTE